MKKGSRYDPNPGDKGTASGRHKNVNQPLKWDTASADITLVMAARLRLLVVDDAEEIRVTLRAALLQLGHIVEMGESAETGLEMFEAGRFDAVITDLYLPGMNG